MFLHGISFQAFCSEISDEKIYIKRRGKERIRRKRMKKSMIGLSSFHLQFSALRNHFKVISVPGGLSTTLKSKTLEN